MFFLIVWQNVLQSYIQISQTIFRFSWFVLTHHIPLHLLFSLLDMPNIFHFLYMDCRTVHCTFYNHSNHLFLLFRRFCRSNIYLWDIRSICCCLLNWYIAQNHMLYNLVNQLHSNRNRLDTRCSWLHLSYWNDDQLHIQYISVDLQSRRILWDMQCL